MERIYGKAKGSQARTESLVELREYPPEDEDIKRAVHEGRLQPERNDLNQHLGDRQWHIERIAYLAHCWNDNDPIRMKRLSNMAEIDNGAHRLVAARYRKKKETISAYEKPGD